MKIEKVKLLDLISNDYNPNEMPSEKLAQLKKTIKKNGYWQFIVVRKQGDKYVIIDGEHRWLAMKDEPEFQEPQYVIVLENSDEADAKIQTLNFNMLRGELNSLKVANIIHDLLQRNTMEQLESILGMTKEEIKVYDEMAVFDFSKYEEPNENLENKKPFYILSFSLEEEEDFLFKKAVSFFPNKDIKSALIEVIKSI